VIVTEGEEEFPLDSLGLDSIRGQHDKEPIASLESFANFVVPLSGDGDVSGAIPVRNPVAL